MSNFTDFVGGFDFPYFNPAKAIAVDPTGTTWTNSFGNGINALKGDRRCFSFVVAKTINFYDDSGALVWSFLPSNADASYETLFGAGHYDPNSDTLWIFIGNSATNEIKLVEIDTTDGNFTVSAAGVVSPVAFTTAAEDLNDCYYWEDAGTIYLRQRNAGFLASAPIATKVVLVVAITYGSNEAYLTLFDVGVSGADSYTTFRVGTGTSTTVIAVSHMCTMLPDGNDAGWLAWGPYICQTNDNEDWPDTAPYPFFTKDEWWDAWQKVLDQSGLSYLTLMRV